jgi:hypothetical protein
MCGVSRRNERERQGTRRTREPHEHKQIRGTEMVMTIDGLDDVQLLVE